MPPPLLSLTLCLMIFLLGARKVQLLSAAHTSKDRRGGWAGRHWRSCFIAHGPAAPSGLEPEALSPNGAIPDHRWEGCPLLAKDQGCHRGGSSFGHPQTPLAMWHLPLCFVTITDREMDAEQLVLGHTAGGVRAGAQEA